MTRTRRGPCVLTLLVALVGVSFARVVTAQTRDATIDVADGAVAFDARDASDALDALDALDDGPDSPATGPRSPRHRAAMALTDAMIWRPADIEDRVVDDVHRHFRPSEAVELVLDVMRNAANKIAVALAADAARVTEGTEVYDIDEDGTMRFEPDAPT